MSMQVSRIVKENLLIDSKSYNSLSPIMKDAVKDVFSFYEEAKGNIVERFESAIKEVVAKHNIEVKQLEDYFEEEAIERLGE
jgi:TRAP-type C4-dicarboxylate transport system substrate-binding protein